MGLPAYAHTELLDIDGCMILLDGLSWSFDKLKFDWSFASLIKFVIVNSASWSHGFFCSRIACCHAPDDDCQPSDEGQGFSSLLSLLHLPHRALCTVQGLASL